MVIMVTFTELFSQVNHENTTTNELNSSAIGTSTIANGSNSFAAGYFSSAIGQRSISLGTYCESGNTEAISIGSYAISGADGSFTLGRLVETSSNASQAMVIGMGVSQNYKLVNSMVNSLAIGFNSTKPTLFVSQAPSNVGYTLTGKVSIGNISDANGYYFPQAKLHLRADESEIAAMLIEPYNWAGGSGGKSISENGAYLFLGNSNHSVGATSDLGLLFNSESNYIFGEGNIGAGVDDPKTKLHVNGDIMFENDFDGMIMKSPDGQCWKGNMSNEGELVFISIDCESLSGMSNKEEKTQIFIYPNPASNQITVEYTGDQQSVRLTLNTINNALISTHKIYQGDNTIAINGISSQMIIATIFDTKGNVVSSKKIMISN